MAHHTSQLLDRQPQSDTFDRYALQACIDECRNCVEVCRACSSADESETNPAEMLRCIRLNLDCADICEATADVLERHGEPEKAILQAQVMSALVASQACAAECDMHTEMQHCQLCAQACHSCATACQQVLDHLHP